MMKTKSLCGSCLLSMLVASSAFVLEHNAIMQQRESNMQLNLKQTVSKQVSFSKLGTSSSYTTNTSHDDHDENIFHRRIVHFEHQRQSKDDNNRNKHRTKSYSGWNQREFAKSIDP